MRIRAEVVVRDRLLVNARYEGWDRALAGLSPLTLEKQAN